MRNLKPTGVGLIAWLLCLVFSAIIGSGSTGTMVVGDESSRRTTTSIAFGSIIADTDPNGTSWHIGWPLFAVLGISYVVSAIAGNVLIRLLPQRRPSLAFGGAALVLIAGGMAAAAYQSFTYWGYATHRPGPIGALSDLTHVDSVAYVRSGGSGWELDVQRIGPPDEAGQLIERPKSFAEELDGCRRDRYYCLEDRLVEALDSRGLLPAKPGQVAELSRIESAFRSHPLIQKSGAGYDSQKDLRGIVVTGLDDKGERLVVVGMRGGQVSNDHYPYNEAVFRGLKLTYAGGQVFFYDVAGLEGMEWPGMAVMFSILALAGGLPIFAGISIWVGHRQRVRLHSLPPTS